MSTSKNSAPKYQSPKYPRVMVSPARHKKLAAEAKAMGISISEVAESKFASAQ